MQVTMAVAVAVAVDQKVVRLLQAPVVMAHKGLLSLLMYPLPQQLVAISF
jgi:hypothetical protein